MNCCAHFRWGVVAPQTNAMEGPVHTVLSAVELVKEHLVPVCEAPELVALGFACGSHRQLLSLDKVVGFVREERERRRLLRVVVERRQKLRDMSMHDALSGREEFAWGREAHVV